MFHQLVSDLIESSPVSETPNHQQDSDLKKLPRAKLLIFLRTVISDDAMTIDFSPCWSEREKFLLPRKVPSDHLPECERESG